MKKYFIRKAVLLLTVWLSVSVLLPAQSIKIKLVETSDVHGAIVPYDLVNDTSMNSSLAQVHTYTSMLRRFPGQKVVLLDNGDILQGDPLVYYYNYVDTSSKHIYAEAMNFMKYDAATIGNHDIETGHKVYDKFRSEINFPWLAANAIDTETGEPYFTPYTVIERGGVKIAVLGLVTPGIPHWLPEILWEGIEFEDMIETAKKWIPIIKEKENPDLLIGLFHSGIDYSYGGETKDTYRNENASQLVAEQVPGFDVIFVGHDHHGWNYKTVNSSGDSVLVLGTLSRAKTVAVATVLMDYDSVSGKWTKESITGEIVDPSKYKADDHFMSSFMMKLNIVHNYVSESLGKITKTISTRQALFGPSEFTDLIHTFQLEKTGADISFTAPLSFDATIDSGWIHVRDMFKLYRYENFLYTMELTGKEIKDYLEYSYGKWFNQMKSAEDHLLNFKRDENGNIIYSERTGSPELAQRYYNFSSAAGIKYLVDVSKPAGERVFITSMTNGSLFSERKKYKVAVSSYRGNGGGYLLTKGAGIPEEELPKRVLSSTDKDLRYYLMKWIEEKKIITPVKLNNWRVIPIDWWKIGVNKDYKILFGE